MRGAVIPWRLTHVAGAALAALLILRPSPAHGQDAPAQDAHVHDAASAAPPPAAAPAPVDWQWQATGNAFIGFNGQQRRFRDFTAWESQNWLMLSGQRTAAAGTWRLMSMLTLEPFSMRALGSPQVFQTGETFGGAPLIDYQHPHDLFMGLGTDYRRALGPVSAYLGVDVVGMPTLGPMAFMHRASARHNPQAPLSHHYMDSTHITPGVVRAGVERAGWRVEGSWFQGREPDERRTDIDFGPLDSWAVRLSWTRGAWSAQASGASLTKPEAVTPYDAETLTASVAYDQGGRGRSLAWLASFGQKREVHGNLEAYLFEATGRITASDAVYTRAESVAKDILDAGFHAGVFHRHRQSQVGALTAGYARQLRTSPFGRLLAGADVTGYVVPDNLATPYGSPLSVHAFLQLQLGNPFGAMTLGQRPVPVHRH